MRQRIVLEPEEQREGGSASAITELVQWKRGRALEAESVLLEGTGLTAEELKGLFGKMLLIRRFEEAVEQAFRRGQIGGYVHVYIG